MTPFERIGEMFRLASTENRIFPGTVFYNEGWLLRFVLDWFSRNRLEGNTLNFAEGARWYSEALLPSQFRPRNKSDPLAEGWTHADGVVGHVRIGDTAIANTTLADNASQFLVTEAKLFSPLSPRVKNAAYFDQAARTVACIAQVLSKAKSSEAKHRPEHFSSLGFFVIAPQEQIRANVFRAKISSESIQSKVRKRVSEYPFPARKEKERWLQDWFVPTLLRMKVGCIAWEDIIRSIRTKDANFGSELSDFYEKCLCFNGIQEPDLRYMKRIQGGARGEIYHGNLRAAHVVPHG
jgi:hypothetical protein